MDNLIKAVKCYACGTLHEEKAPTYVKVNTGVTPDGKPITACYCSRCYNPKKLGTQQEQLTKKGLLCG